MAASCGLIYLNNNNKEGSVSQSFGFCPEDVIFFQEDCSMAFYGE